MRFLCSFYAIVLILIGCNSETEPIGSEFFKHGVASGDPLADRVILWTRISPDSLRDTLQVAWEISTNENFQSVVSTGKIFTGPERDYTIKVDAAGLEPGTDYYYRFSYNNTFTDTGKTRTLDADPDSLRFAVVSCSNYEWGYFNAYRKIAEKQSLDAVIHLGDYIYEQAPGEYGDTTLGRFHVPAKELITLEDYRIRYGQYRQDPDLQAVHAAHPFITIWDDHELINDTYAEGAKNHQPHEGDFRERRAAAVKAYYEWMPVREGKSLYRNFKFGDLTNLVMLDERTYRSKQAEGLNDPILTSEDRMMLGEEQMSWLQRQLSDTTSTWKIIGNQVLFSDLNQQIAFPDWPLNPDSWSGYPLAKKRVTEFVKEEGIQNVVIISGDTHSTYVLEAMDKSVAREAFMVEFGTPSISSSNQDERTTLDSARIAESILQNTNPHLKYTNLVDHGYFLMSVSDDRVTVRYYFVDTVKKPESGERMAKKFWVNKGAAIVKQFSLY